MQLFWALPTFTFKAKVRRAFTSRNQRCAPTVAQSLTHKPT